MKSKFNLLFFAAIFGGSSVLVFSAEISPPETRVIARYLNGAFELNKMTVNGVGFTGSADFAATSLFKGGGVPDLAGTLNATLELYGKNQDTDSILDNKLDSVSLSTWLPHIGVRWTNTIPYGGPVAGAIDMLALQKPTNVVDDAINTWVFGSAGTRKLALAGKLISRMDWPSTVVVAGSVKDPTARNLIIRRYWYPLDLETFEPLPGVNPIESMETLKPNNLAAGIAVNPSVFNQWVTMPGYSGSGATIIGGYSNWPLTPLYPGNGLVPVTGEPANRKTTAGREVWTVELNRFDPENSSFITRDQGYFTVDVFPQPSAVINVPADKLVAAPGGPIAKVNGSSDWSPEIVVSHLFPATFVDSLFPNTPTTAGAIITASVVKAGDTSRELVLDPVTVSNATGTLPKSVTFSIPQTDLIPSINPTGSYTLTIFHLWNGVSEPLASLKYVVEDRITVHANIVEIVK